MTTYAAVRRFCEHYGVNFPTTPFVTAGIWQPWGSGRRFGVAWLSDR